MLALTVALVGCGDDRRAPGEHYHYVISELRVPTSNLTARADGLDLDGDQRIDNGLGEVFGALETVELGVGGTAREALLRGGIVMLADLETLDFEDDEETGFMTYLGGTVSPAPCLDPLRLDSCGQHLLGTGEFTVDLGAASGEAVGPIVGGVFLETAGVLPVAIAIDPSAPIRLDLHASRVRLAQISESHISGILGGGITQADIDGVVIPEATSQLARIVRDECAKPGGSPPCGCVAGERAKLMQDLFDTDDDCVVEVTEVAANSIVRDLLKPDIEVDGERLLSFGVGVELSPATFQ